MLSRLEILVDAIAFHNNLSDPESLAYKLRNPLLVKSFGRPGKHEIDEEGRRVFSTIVAGYRACIFDIQLKVSGKSRAGLNTDNTVEHLLGTYGIKGPAAVGRVVKFLRKAASYQELSGNTPLSYFLESPESEQKELLCQ